MAALLDRLFSEPLSAEVKVEVVFSLKRGQTKPSLGEKIHNREAPVVVVSLRAKVCFLGS